MKKSFLFASFVAMVAILATSCEQKPAGDAPKARFTYEVSGLEVTFTNNSEGAESYAWDFGDGATDTAANPIHEYAQEGTYKVTLTAANKSGKKSVSQSVVVEKPLFVLKIDGKFDDWGNLPADMLVQASSDDWAYYEHLYNMKFISDTKKVYFYLEYDAEAGAVEHIDMMITTDDAATGMSTYLWDPSSVNILIEGVPDHVEDKEGVSDGFKDAGVFAFTGATPEDWSWDAIEAAGALNACMPVTLANGHKAIEGSILRSILPGLKVFRVGVFTSNAEWAESGSLPQITIDSSTGENVAQPMLEVKLN